MCWENSESGKCVEFGVFLKRIIRIKSKELMVMEMRKRFEYEISVGKKVVWHGLNPKKKYDEIRKKYPGREVAIAWKSRHDILVC